jgi:hypothetical protein
VRSFLLSPIPIPSPASQWKGEKPFEKVCRGAEGIAAIATMQQGLFFANFAAILQHWREVIAIILCVSAKSKPPSRSPSSAARSDSTPPQSIGEGEQMCVAADAAVELLRCCCNA